MKEETQKAKKVSKKQQKKIDEKQEKKRIKEEKKEHRKQSKGWKAFKIIMIILLILILIFAGLFTYRVARNGWGLQGFIAAAMGHDEQTLKDLDKITFLLVGISGYEEDYKLADTIMVCSYDPKTQNATLLSIPRDTYVGKNKLKASASYKINAVYQNGKNINGMVESIEGITGLEIDNYLVVDTAALRELVDAIGGVEFEVPIDMEYDDVTQNLHIDLKAGYQKLTGQQAEWLVRFRHNNDGTSYPEEYGDNDIGRMRTQREFITATLKQTLQPSNIMHLTKIGEALFKNINTNMTFNTIKDYIPYAVNFNAENLRTGTLPGTPEKCNGVWIYTVNKKETKTLINDLFTTPEETDQAEQTNTMSENTVSTSKEKSELKIEVLNGSGTTSKLSKVTKLLKEKGYNVTKTGNTTTTSKTTIVNKTNQSETTTKQIKTALGVGTTSTKTDNSSVDYTITIGKDYK